MWPNTFNVTTVNERYQQNNMLSKIPIPTWRKHSKEMSNTRAHPKTLFRLAKPNVLFSKGNSDGYAGKMEEKNNGITDDAQKRCVNGNKICMITKEQ